ncbi:MAG TPA: GntR family transcriptional regulator [Gemmatimonadaceae bacterium]|nr:GntR family transcriptional regulator [Gemmatimonadaceae bacterium]
MTAATAIRKSKIKTEPARTPYEELRALIVRGRLPPGARVAEGPLADWLGVSRTPVREALQRLRQQRLLVEVGGGAGVRVRLAVAPLRRDQVEELYGLAGALESFAVRGLVAWADGKRDRLARQLESIERSFAKEAAKTPLDFDKLFELHDSFHRELTRDVIGPDTAALLETTRPHRDRYEWFYAPLIGPDFTATKVEHGEIIAALREGSKRRLERAVQANWENAAARLAPVIEEYDTRIRLSGLQFSLARI